MAKNFTIYVGTIGTGLWRSPDGGENWSRVGSGGLWGDSRVFGVTIHPEDPNVIFAGADDGIYRSADRGQSFERLESPLDQFQVWKIAIDPVDPDTIFAGTRPSALFRSRDGGQHWDQLSVELADECPNVRIPRVTALVVDPSDHNVIWAGVEVDGVRRSLDGGDTWTHIQGGLNDPDIHDMAISMAEPKTVLTITPGEIFASTDVGESWQGLGVRKHFNMPYCRSVAVKEDDPKVIFIAAGDAPVGITGNLQRSRDMGQTWERIEMPVDPNTPMWAFATHPVNPDLILSCSHYGELFASADGGDWWVKLRREFTEVRSLAWTPN